MTLYETSNGRKTVKSPLLWLLPTEATETRKDGRILMRFKGTTISAGWANESEYAERKREKAKRIMRDAIAASVDAIKYDIERDSDPSSNKTRAEAILALAEAFMKTR